MSANVLLVTVVCEAYCIRSVSRYYKRGHKILSKNKYLLFYPRHNMFDKERKCHGVAYLLLQLLVNLFNLSISTTTAQEISVSEIDGAFGVCTPSMQGEALGNAELWKCNPRDQVVNLEVPNTTFSDMRPNYVRIKRCGGTCSSNL